MRRHIISSSLVTPDLGMTSAAGFMLAPAFCPMVMVTVPTVRPISSPAGEWPCDMRHELT